MGSNAGLSCAILLAKREQVGITVVLAARPCAWGSVVQNLHHKKRLGADEKYQAHMDEQ